MSSYLNNDLLNNHEQHIHVGGCGCEISNNSLSRDLSMIGGGENNKSENNKNNTFGMLVIPNNSKTGGNVDQLNNQLNNQLDTNRSLPSFEDLIRSNENKTNPSNNTFMDTNKEKSGGFFSNMMSTVGGAISSFFGGSSQADSINTSRSQVVPNPTDDGDSYLDYYYQDDKATDSVNNSSNNLSNSNKWSWSFLPKLSTIWIGIIIAIFLVILILFILYFSNNPDVYRFYRPSCPYCVQSEPEWNKFVSSVKNNKLKLNIYNINLDESRNLYLKNKFDITSVPTIVGVSKLGFRKKFDLGASTASADQLYNWSTTI